MCSSCSLDLKKFGWNTSRANIPSAYLVGMLLAKKSKEKKAILDLGLQTPVKGSRIFAVVRGCIDGGMDIPHSDEILPGEDRIRGKHIGNYAASIEKKPEYKKRFSKYLENKIEPKEFTKYFEETKKKISGESK